MNENGLAVIKPQFLANLGEVERAALAMSKSGYFQDANQQAQAIVKILAGQEMGFGPFASMNGIHIIKGKPGIGANLQAAAVKSSGKYDYKVREMTDKTCKLEFFQGKESLGFSEFTLEDARKAGTQNLDKFPRNMLFARAMSNGVKWYCPDCLNGVTAYTPEELGAKVNEDGDVIDLPPSAISEQKQTRPAITPDEPIIEGETTALPKLRYNPEQLILRVLEISRTQNGEANGKRGVVIGMLDTILSGTTNPTESRHMLLKYLTGKASTKDIPDNMMLALYKWLNPKQDSGGEWQPDQMSVREALAAFNACQPK